MKHIDAESLYEYLEQVSELYPRYADNIVDNAVSNVIGGIKTFITSHQQEPPEVDLITEYDEQFNSDPVYGKLVNRIAGIAIARHFYELGLNARKEG